MLNQVVQTDWSSLTRDGRPPLVEVSGLLTGLASYHTPLGQESEFSGYEFPYQDIVADNPELVPYLIPHLLEILDDASYQGKWRVLSMILEPTHHGWAEVIERHGGPELLVQIRVVISAGFAVYRQCLNDPEPRTRLMAAFVLGECHATEARSALCERLPRETDAEVREIIGAIQQRLANSQR